MLDILVNSPFVTEETFTYLTFAAETAVAALILHGQWAALFFGLWFGYNSVADDLSSTITFLKDNFYLDLTTYEDQIAANAKYLKIGGIISAVIASQDIMNYSLGKAGDSLADSLFAQFLGFSAAIINGIVVIGG